MNLEINHLHTIESVQENFQKHFPYLKIEFYSKTHDLEEATGKYFQLHHSLTIGKAQLNPKDGVIHITPDMRVKDLEQLFHDVFELNVQIFRLSGKVWIQTTTTDHLTIAEQNKMALEMSQKINDTNEPVDIHEQE